MCNDVRTRRFTSTNIVVGHFSKNSTPSYYKYSYSCRFRRRRVFCCLPPPTVYGTKTCRVAYRFMFGFRVPNGDFGLLLGRLSKINNTDEVTRELYVFYSGRNSRKISLVPRYYTRVRTVHTSVLPIFEITGAILRIFLPLINVAIKVTGRSVRCNRFSSYSTSVLEQNGKRRTTRY